MNPVAFPPRDESLHFLLMLNTHYRDVGQRAIVLAPLSIGDAEIHLHVDLEGILVWLQEYLRLRVNGYTHLDAVADVFAQINDIWFPANAPHPRPAPPVVTVPVPPPVPEPPAEPAPNPTTALGRMVIFAQFYLDRCHALRWGPDASTTRDSRVEFLRQAIIAYRAKTGDKSFVMKRADRGRPVGDDVIVFMDDPRTGDYRRYWDFIGNAGIDAWVVKRTARELGEGEILDTGQILVDPVSLQNIVG